MISEFFINRPVLANVLAIVIVLIGGVALVEKVDDHYIELLPITMAATNALLDTLRVPRQVVVDDEIAELQVDTFRCSFSGNENLCFIAEVIDKCRAAVDGRAAGDTITALMVLQPALINTGGCPASIRTTEGDQLAVVSMRLQKRSQVILGAARFGEDYCFARRLHAIHVIEADIQSAQ